MTGHGSKFGRKQEAAIAALLTQRMWKRQRSPSIPIVSTAFAGMALAHYADPVKPSDAELEKAAKWLLAHQVRSGEVPADHNEAPVDQGSLMTTADAASTFEAAFRQTHGARYRLASDRALRWIISAEAETTQVKVFLILALSRFITGPQRQLILKTVAQLKREQREDGGWAEKTSMSGSSPYATGQVL